MAHSAKLTKVSRSLMRYTLRLLDMEYKPRELAEELHTSNRHIYSLVNMGCPVRRDNSGRYWIHGETFAKFLKDTAAKDDKQLKERLPMAANDCYCVTCAKIVTYTETKRVENLSYGKCEADHNVSRFVSKAAAQRNQGK